MKRPFHPVLVAFGIATLCLLAIVGPLIAPAHTALYHTSGPALTLFVMVLFDLFLLWALLSFALLLAEKPGRRQFEIWSAILFSLPWILLKNISMLAGFVIPHTVTVSLLALCLTAFVTLSVFWRPAFLPPFQRLEGLLSVVLGFVALYGIFIVGQLLWYGWQARELSTPIVLHQHSVSSHRRASAPRIIWIVLDELSYQQVYERRFPGLELPAFDAIARESVVFTHVVPAANFTERAIPSLMTGLPVDDIRVSSSGAQLSLHRPDTKTWQPFDPHQTVFQDALNAGYSTAVAGWYNPYCRILPEVLDHCFWTFQLPYPGGIVAGQSLSDNLLRQMAHRIKAISVRLPGQHPASAKPQLETRLHIADYRELRSAGDSMLADSDADFVFLHMPIPHPEGIYDRRNKILTTGPSSYIDNLALADSYVAHVRSLLQQRNEWDSSAIVIMGDHSWRTSFLWSKMRGWMPEEEAASHGAQFDDRPAYIVKLPGQQLGSRIDTPFKAVHTRSLLDALIAGQLHTSGDLDAWVKQQK
ncbi:sulfatase-like hydrolase/transferase [Edaphobacter paludis]|uniref:Sulfatase-like hydrolase/transferase n=1 Tax=Edaphobacter paludis TaxID=3035702 RepID=A0AAU7CYJ1_9BACT